MADDPPAEPDEATGSTPTAFVPADFEPPTVIDGDGFRLEPLGPEHNERDHGAWMSSIDFIHTLPGFIPPEHTWPVEMTLEQNLDDMIMHADHFRDREGFTYSVLDGDEVVGCVYVYPTDREGYDAAVRSWVTEARAELDPVFRAWMVRWLREAWPFTSPFYEVDSPIG